MLCFLLSPIALFIIFSYSYSKRFTHLTHYWLGLSLAIAPVGAWIAVTGVFEMPPIILGFAVLTWVAGFDIIYSIQDFQFDLKKGLHSMVSKLGIRKALIVSRLLHTATIIILTLFSYSTGRGFIFYTGIIITASLLFYEHSLVKPDNIERIDAAFFTVNGLVSVLLLLAGSVDISFNPH